MIGDFWSQVKTNLQVGTIRLIFVADVIPKELQRIVEFLNKQMDPAEVLAVEMRQYVGEGLKTLVPTIIGLRSKIMAGYSYLETDISDLIEANK